METVSITLTKATLLLEIRQKSHLEVQNIQDAEARDNVRAGVEKVVEVERCLKEAVTLLTRICSRYVTATTDVTASYGFTLTMSSRRKSVKSDAIQDAMEDFAVQYALMKFYSSVSQADLSSKHAALAQDAELRINELLYSKKEPTYV